MMYVTWNTGRVPDGVPPLRGGHVHYHLTWASLDALAAYCTAHGVTALVTECEHSGTAYHYGAGGYRYRHDRAFRLPAVTA